MNTRGWMGSRPRMPATFAYPAGCWGHAEPAAEATFAERFEAAARVAHGRELRVQRAALAILDDVDRLDEWLSCPRCGCGMWIADCRGRRVRP